MLSITLVPVRVPELVDKIVKLFQVEMDTDGISLKVVRDIFYDKRSIDFVYCNPSCLTQVFMNLISNAIKFIRGRPQRMISIRYGVTRETPGEKTATMTGQRLWWSLIPKQ